MRRTRLSSTAFVRQRTFRNRATGACGSVGVRVTLRAARGVNARAARELDGSTCEQGAIGQSLAGMVVGGKNRCIRLSGSAPSSRALATPFRELTGTISGTILGTAGFPVTQSLAYT